MGFLGISANQIKGIANKALQDTSVTVSVTYKSLSSSFNSTTRKTTETITSISTRALKSEYSLDEIFKGGGTIKENDVKFLIRADALSSVAVKVDDRINWDSKDWEIIGPILPIEIGSTGIFYKFHCR